VRACELEVLPAGHPIRPLPLVLPPSVAATRARFAKKPARTCPVCWERRGRTMPIVLGDHHEEARFRNLRSQGPGNPHREIVRLAAHREQDIERFREKRQGRLWKPRRTCKPEPANLPRDLQTVVDAILAASRFVHVKLSCEHNDPLRRFGHLVAPLLVLPKVKTTKRPSRVIKSIAVD